MAEYIAIEAQTLQPGEAVVFNSSDPCTRGFVRHRDDGLAPADGDDCIRRSRS